MLIWEYSQGVFQEININSGEIIFEWHSLNHIDPSKSYVAMNTTDVSGNGFAASTAWDYFHINSIDKDPAGNYLVSSRHCNSIYSISAENGTLLWELNGLSSNTSTFALTNFNFTSQHDIRYVSGNETTTIVSFFDNASNGFATSSSESAGMVVALHHATTPRTATLLQSFPAPVTNATPNGLLSASQGNIQFLSSPDTSLSSGNSNSSMSGNVFVGWGSNCFIAEYTFDGTPALFATFASTGSLQYRSYKANFTAAPLDAPALAAYAQNNNTGVTYYMSWNGCTECASWTLHTSSEPSSSSSFTASKSIPKVGFETSFTTSSFETSAFVEAFDASGKSLANSSLATTFVPGSELKDDCNAAGCAVASTYAFVPEALAVTTVSLYTQNGMATATASGTAASSTAKKSEASRRNMSFVASVLSALFR